MLITLALHVSLTIPETPSIKVCTNRACRKGGSLETLNLFKYLVSTAPLTEEDSVLGDATAANMQQMSAQAHVQPCGCLGGCGSGPNVVLVNSNEILHHVYKPITALALLQVSATVCMSVDHQEHTSFPRCFQEEVGLRVPDVAAQAYLKKMRADQAMVANQASESATPISTRKLWDIGCAQREVPFSSCACSTMTLLLC